MHKVAILLFDEVEVLDFAGPHEVFGAASGELFDVRTGSIDGASITARGGLRVMPDARLQEIGHVDILVLPGGRGVYGLLGDQEKLDAIADHIPRAKLVLSVCTGALLLAAIGVLSEQSATTHHTAYEKLSSIDPTIRVVRNQRFVDEGSIITSGGVTAGIDAALYLVRRLEGERAARKAANYMEYRWHGPNQPEDA